MVVARFHVRRCLRDDMGWLLMVVMVLGRIGVQRDISYYQSSSGTVSGVITSIQSALKRNLPLCL